MKTFTKGQPVTFLQNWDDKGTVRIVDLTVYSCGKKQMVLVDGSGTKFEGRHFYPGETQHSYSRVVARLTKDDAVAAALALGAEIVAAERDRKEQLIACYDFGEQAGYTKAMRLDIAALHEGGLSDGPDARADQGDPRHLRCGRRFGARSVHQAASSTPL